MYIWNPTYKRIRDHTYMGDSETERENEAYVTF